MSSLDTTPKSNIHVHSQSLLQIHIAEYQALTSRCNYWISIQIALLPLFMAVIGIVAQMWDSHNQHLLIWGGMLTIQIIVMTWLQAGLEIYNTIFYLECELRPLVRETMRSKEHYWSYEAFQARRRSPGPMWEEYALSGCCIIAVGLIALLRWPLTEEGYIGLSLNILLLIPIVIRTWNLVSTRRRFTKCALSR